MYHDEGAFSWSRVRGPSRVYNLLSKACRNSSWSCSVAHDEKAALEEVPGITEEEEEEPDAVVGPHSDVDGITNSDKS